MAMGIAIVSFRTPSTLSISIRPQEAAKHYPLWCVEIM